MMSDQEIIKETVKGNNNAFAAFYAENHDYFFNVFRKKYSDRVSERQSTTKTILADLYHDSAMKVWNKIIAGSLTEKTLTGPLINYMIGVGKGILSNNTKSVSRRMRFLDLYQESFSDGNHRSGRSDSFSYVEVDKGKKTNQPLRVIMGFKGAPVLDSNPQRKKLTYEQDKEREQFINSKLESIGQPCYGLLRATFWEDLKDVEILQEYPSFFNTVGQIRMRRKRCLNSLKSMISLYDKEKYYLSDYSL